MERLTALYFQCTICVDILREIRSENERLVHYICQPEVISELVENSFGVPPPLPPSAQPNGKPPSSPGQAELEEAQKEERDIYMKQAYVSSELLTSESKLISDATLGDDAVMDRIFSCVEKCETGRLHSVVAVYFAKVIMSLLKVRNAKTIEQMSKRGTSFIDGMLKHMDCGPIAELVVRILDSPEPDQAYPSRGNKRPTDEALDLLVRADLFSGLAECFVKTSSDKCVTDVNTLTSMGTHGGRNDSERCPPSAEMDDPKQRRLREETMANITLTILGLTERMLQLPELGCRIPEKLSPFGSPSVISRILDAGLYATCNGNLEPAGSTTKGEYGDTNEERAETFSAGMNSALLLSLGLAADLMTTEANVLRDDDDDISNEDHPAGIPGQHSGVGGRPPYSGKGIGPSVMGDDSAPSADPSATPEKKSEPAKVLPELMGKKVGDNIVETDALEGELAIRFPRLAEMFGDCDRAPSGRLKPLGSLRLKLAEFFVACMKKASQETVDQIMELGVPKKLLDLFGAYQWSSMLHGVITNAIVSALEGEEGGRPARQAWFRAGVIPWLMDSWSRNTKGEETGSLGSRAGYMGHLIRIGTFLKSYIEENQADPNADLPDKAEIDAFAVFAEQVLAPAHFRESTPLCEDSRTDSGTEGDEGEEARDVLDMGGISFVDNAMGNSSGKDQSVIGYEMVKQEDDLEEEEEIMAVEVGHLTPFAPGRDDWTTNEIIMDHDIPKELREKLLHIDEDGPITRIVETESSESSETKVSRTESQNVPESAKDIPSAETVNFESESLKEITVAVDSSSEDEGSYEAFVDDRRDSTELQEATGKLGRLELSGSEPNPSSLEGAVTEIEEPGPLNSGGNLLQSLASNVVSAGDDGANSSDEEYEAWEDPVRVVESSNSERPFAEERQTSETIKREVA